MSVSSFYVENFGCRATQADGAAIEQQFRDSGLDRASAPARADYVILNTCAVTAAAEQDARAAVLRGIGFVCKQHLLAYAPGILSGSRVRRTTCSLPIP